MTSVPVVCMRGRMSWRGMVSSKSMPGCFETTCWSRIGQAGDWKHNLSLRGLALFILTVTHKSDNFKCATIAILIPYNLTQNFQYGTFPKSFPRTKNKSILTFLFQLTFINVMPNFNYYNGTPYFNSYI